MIKFTSLTAFVLIYALTFGQSSKITYNTKSSKFAYRYELSGVEATITFFIDDFGKKQAFEMISKVDGYNQKVRTIVTPETMYIVNYEDKQVLKFPVGADENTMEMYGVSNDGLDLGAIVSDVTSNIAGKKGTADILGKTCDIFEYTDASGSKGKYWVFNNYLFKAEYIDANGEHAYIEVVDFKIDTPIDSKEFDIPSGFVVTDMTQTMEQMKQMQQKYGVPDEE